MYYSHVFPAILSFKNMAEYHFRVLLNQGNSNFFWHEQFKTWVRFIPEGALTRGITVYRRFGIKLLGEVQSLWQKNKNAMHYFPDDQVSSLMMYILRVLIWFAKRVYLFEFSFQVQELVPLGSMLTYLLEHPNQVSPNYELKLWASQIACGEYSKASTMRTLSLRVECL